MHVRVRDRVKQHPEWDAERWGLPISQSAVLPTLLGGSVAPALGLFALGHLTSPHGMRAVLHFNRYCGHLVGVRCDGYFPETVAGAWRIVSLPTPRAATTASTTAPNSSNPWSPSSKPPGLYFADLGKTRPARRRTVEP